MKFSTISIILLASASKTNAHGILFNPAGPKDMSPHGWEDKWFSQGSEIGCPVATGENCGNAGVPCCEEERIAPTLKDVRQLTYKSDAFWTALQHFEKTIPSLRGAANVPSKDFPSVTNTYFKHNPWLAPGHAPVANSCGILGGWQYKSARDYIAGPGDAYEKYKNALGGPTNSAMPPANMTVPAGTGGDVVLLSDVDRRMQEAQGKEYSTNDNPTWKAGSVQEVAYSLTANHGGGFQYRICPLEFLLNGTLDEGCFEALDFVGDESWFKYTLEGTSDIKSITFTPVRVSDANTNGVLPKGSTWTQIGLPACSDTGTPKGSGNCSSPMFENEISDEGIWGAIYDGMSTEFAKVSGHPYGGYEIVDKVQIPDTIKAGDYVFSWRWDSEETPQVWTQCSIVTIEA